MNDFTASSRTLNLPRHGHNMSHELLFTSSVGQLLPVYFDYLTPRDEVSITPELFTRTQPVLSAALTDIDEYVDFFFIPLRKLNSYGNEILTNVDDLSSSVFARKQNDNTPYNLFKDHPDRVFPRLDLANFATALRGNVNYQAAVVNNTLASRPENQRNTLISFYKAPSPYGSEFDSWQRGAVRLLDILGLPCEALITPMARFGTGDSPTYDEVLFPIFATGPIYSSISPAALLCYQACYYDYYRLSQYEDCNVFSFNIDKYFVDKQNYADQDYGHLLTCTAHAGQASNLWHGPFGFIGPAYDSTDIARTPGGSLLTMRYRALDKDYFTSVKPSPLSGSIGVLNNNGAFDAERIHLWLNQYGCDVGAQAFVPNGNGVDYGEVVNDATDVTGLINDLDVGVSGYNFSVASIRTMFAVERLLKVLGRNGKHYDDQVLARFGAKVPQGYSNEVVHFGTYHQVINIGEIVSTADTTSTNNPNQGSPLGKIAGRGVGYKKNDDKKFKFTAPVHGFIMAIYSAVPRVNWISGVLRQHTALNVYDFPVPEFDQLGSQPLFSFEVPTGIYKDIIGNTERLGWQKRWLEYKARYSRATHAFSNYYTGSKSNGAFGSWTITKDFASGSAGGTNMLPSLLCSPTMLDQIMLQGYQNVEKLDTDDEMYNVELSVNNYLNTQNVSFASDLFSTYVPNFGDTLYYSDPLMHELKFKAYKTSWMSSSSVDNV